MSEIFLEEIRKIPSLDRAIVSSVVLVKAKSEVEVSLITDKRFEVSDEAAAKSIVRKFVPDIFSCSLHISKLTPDEGMIEKKILQIISETNRSISVFITEGDVKVKRTESGFSFTISVINLTSSVADYAHTVAAELSKCFCGEFTGRCVQSARSIDDVEVEEKHVNEQFELPTRTFKIEKFEFLEGVEEQKTAVYIADLNFISESVAICGKILNIREKTITTSSGREKLMFYFTVGDTTATIRVGYFARQKSIEKIRKLKVGDSIVLTCKTELYNGEIRPTANYIDIGNIPKNFTPEKRPSKPVPKYYETVFPQPYVDFTQSDIFTDPTLPECLTKNNFVVFDLETTGLNSSPSSGMMDSIIEIGAYKIIGGEIKESFTTFVNPRRKLPEEICKLTGIDQQTVDRAPAYDKVMPDFFKFFEGCYLVGHNAANFDYKFVDYYCSKCGYMPERKLFDTLPLSQALLRLPNYKLNTIADKFGIKFNHHRAEDDALVTAKIFIELIKLKKSLPNPC